MTLGTVNPTKNVGRKGKGGERGRGGGKVGPRLHVGGKNPRKE